MLKVKPLKPLFDENVGSEKLFLCKFIPKELATVRIC